MTTIPRTYRVRVTTEDWDEIVYEVTTTRGALAAVETATQRHHKAGHQLGEVRSVLASASGEHEMPEVRTFDRVTGRPATPFTPPEDLATEAEARAYREAEVADEHSHGGTPSLESGCGQ